MDKNCLSHTMNKPIGVLILKEFSLCVTIFVLLHLHCKFKAYPRLN